MNKYIAKDNERLDSVVYRFYGSLEYFSMVLEANTKLNPLLKRGDVVILPAIEKKESKEEALWWKFAFVATFKRFYKFYRLRKRLCLASA